MILNEYFYDLVQLELGLLPSVSISLGYQDCFYLRQIQIGILIDSNKGLLINYLERAWQDSGVHDFAHGPSRILQVFKSGQG